MEQWTNGQMGWISELKAEPQAWTPFPLRGRVEYMSWRSGPSPASAQPRPTAGLFGLSHSIFPLVTSLLKQQPHIHLSRTQIIGKDQRTLSYLPNRSPPGLTTYLLNSFCLRVVDCRHTHLAKTPPPPRGGGWGGGGGPRRVSAVSARALD